MTRILQVLVVCLATGLPVFPQDAADVDRVQDGAPGVEMDAETAPPRKTATAVRITDEIVIDGRLDEPAWASAPAATGFVQRSPFRGEPASEPTEVEKRHALTRALSQRRGDLPAIKHPLDQNHIPRRLQLDLRPQRPI